MVYRAYNLKKGGGVRSRQSFPKAESFAEFCGPGPKNKGIFGRKFGKPQGIKSANRWASYHGNTPGPVDASVPETADICSVESSCLIRVCRLANL